MLLCDVSLLSGEDHHQKSAHAVHGLQATGSPSSAIMSAFRGETLQWFGALEQSGQLLISLPGAVFQQELDTKHDKYERLVKISRDVTIESKRTIFLLHRVTR